MCLTWSFFDGKINVIKVTKVLIISFVFWNQVTCWHDEYCIKVWPCISVRTRWTSACHHLSTAVEDFKLTHIFIDKEEIKTAVLSHYSSNTCIIFHLEALSWVKKILLIKLPYCGFLNSNACIKNVQAASTD